MINLQFFNPRIKFVSLIIINNQLITDISCVINEWMILIDKRPFSPSVVTNQSIQSQEMKMSEGVNMNSETSKLPLLPIIYCRF